MIEHIWSGRSLFYILLLPFAWLYGGIMALRHILYQQGWFRSWRAPVPVVVVGNLTVGGNGKTPIVIWLVEQLKQRGIKVGVVSRGYGGKSDNYPLLVSATTSPQQAGDEPVLIYQRTGVAVAVAPKRSEAIKALLASNDLDLIITDDGLQHYALQRDIEFVVIDGIRRFGNGWWLPAGPMRERESRLASVDGIITNGGTAQPGEIAMQLKPSQAINLVSGERIEVNQLKQVIAIAGIGHPPRFFNLLKQLSVSVKQEHAFQDHQPYTPEIVTALAANNETLLMTEKDAVKCRPFAKKNWWYLPVDAVFSKDDAEQLLNKVLSALPSKEFSIIK